MENAYHNTHSSLNLGGYTAKKHSPVLPSLFNNNNSPLSQSSTRNSFESYLRRTNKRNSAIDNTSNVYQAVIPMFSQINNLVNYSLPKPPPPTPPSNPNKSIDQNKQELYKPKDQYDVKDKVDLPQEILSRKENLQLKVDKTFTVEKDNIPAKTKLKTDPSDNNNQKASNKKSLKSNNIQAQLTLQDNFKSLKKTNGLQATNQKQEKNSLTRHAHASSELQNDSDSKVQTKKNNMDSIQKNQPQTTKKRKELQIATIASKENSLKLPRELSLKKNSNNKANKNTPKKTAKEMGSIGDLGIKSSLINKANLQGKIKGKLTKGNPLPAKKTTIGNLGKLTEKSANDEQPFVSRETKTFIEQESSLLSQASKDVSSEISDNKASHANILVSKNVSSKPNTDNFTPLLNPKTEPQVLQKFEQLISRSKLILKDQKNMKLSANLYPKELGKVSLTVSMSDGVISGKFLVDNEAVLKLLNEKMQDLLSELTNESYSLDEFEVGLRQDNKQNLPHAREQAKQQGNSTNVSKETAYQNYFSPVSKEGIIYA